MEHPRSVHHVLPPLDVISFSAPQAQSLFLIGITFTEPSDRGSASLLSYSSICQLFPTTRSAGASPVSFMKATNQNTCRFVVAEGDKFLSSVWRIWTNERHDLLMISTSESANFSKVTIHFDSQERFCHFPINKAYKNKMIAQGLNPPRHKDETHWTRTTTPSLGSIPAALCNIILPYNPNYSKPASHANKNVLKLSVPGSGKAWVIRTFVTYDPLIAIPQAYQLRTIFNLATKENVIVVTEVIDFDIAGFLQGKGGDATVLNRETDIADILRKPVLIHFWNDPRKEKDNIFRIWEIGDVTAGGVTITKR